MRCSTAILLLAGCLFSTRVSGLNLGKLKSPSKLNSKKYDVINKGKCKDIKCPPTEELVCVKLRTNNEYSSKNIFVVVINRCELEYMKCHEGKFGSNKRVKRSPDIAAKASRDNNLAPKGNRKSISGNKSPKINYNKLYFGPRKSRKDDEGNEESVPDEFSAEPGLRADHDHTEQKEAFLLTIDSTNADQYSHLTKDDRVVDADADSSEDNNASELDLNEEYKKYGEGFRQIADKSEIQAIESFNEELKNENDHTENEMSVKGDTTHSLSQKGKLSKGSSGSKIRVVINYGRPRGKLDVDDARLMDRETSGEVSVEPLEKRKDQKISSVQSEEVLQERSEEERNQETSPVASEQVLEESNEEQKDEELSPVVTEKVLDETIEKQNEEEISPGASDKDVVESIEKQTEKETPPGTSGEAKEEHSGESKPAKVGPKGQTDVSDEKEGSNQDNKNRGAAVEDSDSGDNGGADYKANFDGTNNPPDYEDVDIDEYKSDCPTVCPARNVMVCARCKEGVYRTFMSVCHLRIFNCKHPEEKLELVSRKPCMLSAPFLNDLPKAKGRVAEPNDADPVLKYLRCKDRVSDDPRCRFGAVTEGAEVR